MITESEYIEALKIIDEYNYQKIKYEIKKIYEFNLTRRKLNTFIELNKDKISTRLFHSLRNAHYRYYNEIEKGYKWKEVEYLDQIKKVEFLKNRNTGLKTWEELESLLNINNI